MSGDPQHPFEDDRGRHAAWILEQSEPTNLIALWPDEQPPSRMEVLSALASVAGTSVKVLEELGERAEEFEWAVIIHVPGFDRPLAVWTEPARPMSDEELQVSGGVRCPWVVGIEGVLEPSDPLRDYTGLMRLLLRSLPDAPAVLDVSTNRWTSRPSLEAMFERKEVEPPADLLWVVEARRRADAEESGCWMRTRGLARCGRPELEMLGVPGRQADTAAEVLSGMAAMLFEAEPPDPGEPWQIGHGLCVCLVPWASLESDVRDELVGGPADRCDDDPAPSAIVCDILGPADPADPADPSGESSCEAGDGPDLARLHPARLLSRLEGEAACGLYWTERATRRQADLARAGWDQFATAWAAMRLSGALDEEQPPAVFGLKAGFPIVDRPELNHEHVWFRVCGFEDEGVRAELVNHPVHDVGLRPGEEILVEPERVADWMVVTRYGSFGPADVTGMWRAVDRLRAEQEKSPGDVADSPSPPGPNLA